MKGGRRMMVKRIVLGTSILLVLLSLALGCSPARSTDSKPIADEPDDGVCKPVKVAVLQDKSKSINWTGTPTLKDEDLDPLIDLLSYCGGELGFGLISDDSNRGLVRLTIDFPPDQPMEPSKEGNPYKVAKKHEEYQRQMDEFNRRLAAWQEVSEQRIVKFKAQVNAILKREKLAKKTDVWDSLRRADLFLSEDDSAWGQRPLVYAVLITDGQDNVKKERIATMKSSAKLLLVNSFDSIGALKDLNPLKFESTESALRFIIADSERRD
jgi:hypothetical protein